MARDISFKTGRRTPTLFRLLRDRYLKEGIDDRYIAFKWEEWAKNSSITVFRAVKNNRVVGWILYDKKTSTIEEMLVEGTWKGKDPRPAMLDTLIARESLVAASLLAADQEKHRFLVEYGFRPVLFFSRNGFDLVKMELSTSVLLKKTAAGKPFHAYRKKERVAVEKIPSTQTYEEIRRGLANLIDRLGGLRRFVKPGQTVAIKPNVVSDHGLKDGKVVGGIVTDIRVVKALTEMLLGLASHVYITEGASINRSATSKMFSHYGYDEIVSLDPEGSVSSTSHAGSSRRGAGLQRMSSRGFLPP